MSCENQVGTHLRDRNVVIIILQTEVFGTVFCIESTRPLLSPRKIEGMILDIINIVYKKRKNKYIQSNRKCELGDTQVADQQ